MAEREIYHLIEFCGDGDPMFGGSAADYGMYRQEDGTHAFMPGMTARARNLAHSYFPTREEAEAAGAEASARGGLVSALPKTVDPRIPTGQIDWLVQRLHVGTPDDEISQEIASRLEKGCEADPEILAQACAYALACHRANQELVREFRL
jgi:hypothetical protein